MRKPLIALVLCTGYIGAAGSAQAQGGFRSSDPNMSHFYMARQEWQYIEDAPVVTGQPGTPGAAQQQGAAAPQRPAPLPKAGWMPYSSSIPSVQNALPKVNNGVPKPMPAAAPGGPGGLRGKAGSLKPQQAKAPAGPQAVKSYAPYKGYGGGATPAPTAAVGAGTRTSTQVQGSVLHWARPKAHSY